MRNHVHWNRVNHSRQWPVAVAEHDRTPVFDYGVHGALSACEWTSRSRLCDLVIILRFFARCHADYTTRSRAINRYLRHFYNENSGLFLNRFYTLQSKLEQYKKESLFLFIELSLKILFQLRPVIYDIRKM